MYKQAKPFFMIVQTPLHAGSGQDLGVIDQPIQRERHTSFPKIEGSSLKGAIREVFEEYKDIKDNIEKTKLKDLLEAFPDFKKNGNGQLDIDKYIKNKDSALSLAFGPENGDDHAGALGFTDARLLLFPVKSMKGVFAYITCPYVLERFKEDLELSKDDKLKLKLENCNFLSNSQAIVWEGSQNKINDTQNKIILEEYCFSIISTNKDCDLPAFLSTLTGIEKLNEKLVILSNDDFKDFVNLSTEVITRTKINPETGTVQSGALFTEEYLPAESVLYSLALTTPIFLKENDKKDCIFKKNGKPEEDNVMTFFELGLPKVIQIGGNATIGKGIVQTKVYETSTNGGGKQ